MKVAAIVLLALLALVEGGLCAIGMGVVTVALVIPLVIEFPSIVLLAPIAGAVATHVVIVRRTRAG